VIHLVAGDQCPVGVATDSRRVDEFLDAQDYCVGRECGFLLLALDTPEMAVAVLVGTLCPDNRYAGCQWRDSVHLLVAERRLDRTDVVVVLWEVRPGEGFQRDEGEIDCAAVQSRYHAEVGVLLQLDRVEGHRLRPPV
jgi:hypothetical protein